MVGYERKRNMRGYMVMRYARNKSWEDLELKNNKIPKKKRKGKISKINP